MVSLSCPRTTRLFIKHQEMTAKRNEIRKVKGTKWRRNWVVTTSLLPYPSLFVILRWHKWLRSALYYALCESLYIWTAPIPLCFPFTFNFFFPSNICFAPRRCDVSLYYISRSSVRFTTTRKRMEIEAIVESQKIYSFFRAHLITHSIQRMKRDKNNSWKTTKHDRKYQNKIKREKGVRGNFKELTKHCQLSKDGTSRGNEPVSHLVVYISPGFFVFISFSLRLLSFSRFAQQSSDFWKKQMRTLPSTFSFVCLVPWKLWWWAILHM